MYTTYTKEVFQCHTLTPDTSTEVVETTEELVNKFDLKECINWITENKYERTCLQFPNKLLNEGVSIALYLQKVLQKVVYVLGDTSYGSCCVDEVAAEHVNGDSIIHFGHSCFSPILRLPVFYVFPKQNFNVQNFCDKLQEFDDKAVLIFYDDAYHYKYSELCNALKCKSNVVVSELNISFKSLSLSNNYKIVNGRIFTVCSYISYIAVYVGEESVTLQNLVLSLPGYKWYQYEPEHEKLTDYEFNSNKFLMKRIHLVEKINKASVIGILIGTLGISNYLSAIERIKYLVKKRGKKCYKLAVGKPNVAKLANFPEIDVFVYISCQENALLKDFKDYYKPIVSLMEVEMALGDRPYSIEYTSDFRELLPGGSFYKSINCDNTNQTLDLEDSSQELLEKDPGTVCESSGAQFLINRTWRGLEQKIGETEVCKAVKGRVGIPQSYENEITTLSENHLEDKQEFDT